MANKADRPVRFGVIGGGGIGAAHTIAARNLGWEMKWMVDTDPKVRDRYVGGQYLVNQWGPITESAMLNDDVATEMHITGMPARLLYDTDVAIVASPHLLHHRHVTQLRMVKDVARYVLVEKPGLVFSYHPLVSFGYKALLTNSVVNRIKTPFSKIMITHDYPPTHRAFPDNILWDLGSHLISILLCSHADVSILDFDLQLMHMDNHTLIFRCGDITCMAAYQFNYSATQRMIWSGITVTDLQKAGADILIDDTICPWDTDIFEKQLSTLYMDGHLPIDCTKSGHIDRALLYLQMQAPKQLFTAEVDHVLAT